MIFRREEPDPDEGSGQGAPEIPDRSHARGSAPPLVEPADWGEGDGQSSVIARNATWSGTLECNGSVEVLGSLMGEVHATGDIYVAPGAQVEARLRAVNVIIAGQFQGSVICDHRFEVTDSGDASGRFHAPTLVIHDGATLNGTFQMSGAPSFEDDQNDER